MFKLDVNPDSASRARTPFAVREDLNQAYDVGIAKGIWKPVTFNEYGTPVVPVRKQSHPNHLRRLDGTHITSKVDLADAYNEIELGLESQRRLFLSTHREVLLQTRLSFGIRIATGTSKMS